MGSSRIDTIVWCLELVKRIGQGGFLLWGFWTAAPLITRNYAEFRRRLEPWGAVLVGLIVGNSYEISISAFQWIAHQTVEVKAVNRILERIGVDRIWIEELLPPLLVNIVAFWLIIKLFFGKKQRDKTQKAVDVETGSAAPVEKQGAEQRSGSSAKNAKEEAG